jgi:hypothetical protein
MNNRPVGGRSSETAFHPINMNDDKNGENSGQQAKKGWFLKQASRGNYERRSSKGPQAVK